MIDIACIGTTSFQHHICNRDTEVFLTSLHEIDQVIEKKQNNEQKQENAAEWEQIQQKLPAWYQKYADVFSKRASDEMPPHQSNDYQIGLEESHTSEQIIGYSLLYKQSAEELAAARDYIIDNLSKGFIDSSAASFASPILMAWKPDDGLWFCVDYQRLNSIIQKDCYPIPLVDELMKRLGKAQIFICWGDKSSMCIVR